MSLVTVIGYGNRLRADDAFGPVVIDELEGRIADPRIELIERSTLTPELAHTLAQTSHVVFVDASAELGPGVVERRSIVVDDSADISLVHFLSPEALLVWAGRVYGKVPRAEIWLIGVSDTGLSERLTPLVAARLPEFLDTLEAHLHELLAALDRGRGSEPGP